MFIRHKFPYILLGIGIGILLTNIIYDFHPKVEYREYSQDEIIEMAKEMGMVFLKDSIKVESSTQDEQVLENAESVEDGPINVQFVIEQGEFLEEIARNLYSEGIIDDVDSFMKYVRSKGLDRRFRVGTYTLSTGMNYDEIIDVLLKREK